MRSKLASLGALVRSSDEAWFKLCVRVVMKDCSIMNVGKMIGAENNAIVVVI